MEESSKDRLVIAAIILILVLLMSLMAVNLNRFGSPTSSNLIPGSGVPQSFSSQEGDLVVSVESNFTLVSNGARPTGLTNQPLSGVFVSITDVQTGSSSFSNLTNSNGNLTVRLPAAKYEIRFVDWRLNFSSVSAEIYKGKITHVEAFLNATGCSALNFVVVDPDSSNWAVGWEQLYMRVPSGGSIGGTPSSTYLEIDNSPLAPTLKDSNLTSLTPVSIVGSLAAQDSQWLMLRVGFPILIQNITAMQLLSLNVSYEVGTN